MSLLLLFKSDSEPIPVNYRDADIYDDVIARLEATGKFTFVDSFEPGGPERTVNNTYLCTVIPGDDEDTDEYDPIVLDRHVRFAVIIDVIEPNPRTRWRKMDELANYVRNALNGQSLADLTFPQLTLVRRSSPGRSTNPSQKLTLTVECVYEIVGFDGNDVTE